MSKVDAVVYGLEGLKNRIDSIGIRAEWASDEDAKARGATRMLRTTDPDGLAVEIVDGTASHAPYSKPDHDLGYRTGELGVGHFTLQAEDLDATERFYVEALGMHVTDYNDLDLVPGVRVKVAFLRANRRHHSIGLASLRVRTARRLNHFFLEVADHHAVGRQFERVREAGIPIAHEVGVHPNDELCSVAGIEAAGLGAQL